MNNLTEEDISTLIKELKSRIQKLFEHRKSESNVFKGCQLKDIHNKLRDKVITDEGSDNLENEFTRLLGKLMDEKPEFFLKPYNKYKCKPAMF
jgi:hypothetical protein